MQIYPGYISLFKGTDDEDIWDAAPYLFEVSDNFYRLRKDPFIQLDHCILFETSETKEEVCRFLQYYMYKKAEYKIAYVRIWDARILIKYLQAWDEKEHLSFFQFFKAVYTEQEDRGWLDKWQLTGFNKPVATPVLKTGLLADRVDSLNDLESSPGAAGAGTIAAGKEAASLPVETGHQPLKRRRFFID